MATKPIRISGHARFEMGRRGISRAEVLHVIRSPGQVLPSVKGRRVYQSHIGLARRLLLRVVVKEDVDAYHVVTAYKTTKIAKYWKNP
jgi:hypothetical protein